MYCTKCGTKLLDGDAFCERCGAPAKSAAQAQQPEHNPQPQPTPQPEPKPQPQPDLQHQPAAEPVMRETAKKSGAGRAAKVVISVVLIVCAAVLAWAGVMKAMGTDPIDYAMSLFGGKPGGEAVLVSGSDTVSESDTVQEEEPEEEYRPTAQKLEQQRLLEQARRIRSLLKSKVWHGELMGYDASIRFKADGSAKITAKYLFFEQSFDAQYELGDDCTFIIRFSYDGKSYKITGSAQSPSDDVILLKTADNQSYKLTAE